MAGDTGTQITAWSVFSVLAGATVSAVVSYVLQQRSFAEARQQKAQDKVETRKTLGLNLFNKMMRIASNSEILKRGLEENISKADEDRLAREAWMFVLPIANLPNAVHFAPEELTMLMQIDLDLFNNLGQFDEIYNSLIEIFAVYGSRRAALTDVLPATMTEERVTLNQRSVTGTTVLSMDEMRRFGPQMVQLNLLVRSMIDRARQDAAEAWVLLDRLRDTLNKEFKLQLSMERK
ncbi:MAG TPA: hypothetical protein VIF88_00620 [Methylocystis sp.]|jgi:hypothetical protein